MIWSIEIKHNKFWDSCWASYEYKPTSYYWNIEDQQVNNSIREAHSMESALG